VVVAGFDAAVASQKNQHQMYVCDVVVRPTSENVAEVGCHLSTFGMMTSEVVV
jgi:hypothetical protein